MKEKFEKIKRKFIEISESNASLSRDDLDQSSGFFPSPSLTQKLRLRPNDAKFRLFCIIFIYFFKLKS